MTPQIEIKDVDKHYGSFHALKRINLTVPKGDFVALVGPSGCGKSTLLRSIAGLERITSGTLSIAGELMTNVPPRKRDVAMVFQSYALYPHMNVLRNLTYSLRLKGMARDAAARRAEETAELIGLRHLLERYPRELSGGQRQRVAMGRAIVRDPKVFLFDEPLSNLDAALRVQMRQEIRALHDRLGATFVYVTHDQIEAMTMADHVVVMRDGIIEQQGTPIELYDRPANRFVAGFIGSPAMNFIPAIIDPDGQTAALKFNGQKLPLGRQVQAGRQVLVGLRPEDLKMAEASPALTTTIASIESTGSLTFYVTASDPALVVVEQGRPRAKSGEAVGLSIETKDIHLFDADTEVAI